MCIVLSLSKQRLKINQKVACAIIFLNTYCTQRVLRLLDRGKNQKKRANI